MHCVCLFLPVQMTPAITVELQLLFSKGLWLHWLSDVSIPLHSIWLSQVSPVPWPYWAAVVSTWVLPQSICLHATFASSTSQDSAHTVRHWPLSKNSTLPMQRLSPPDNFTLPWNDSNMNVKIKGMSTCVPFYGRSSNDRHHIDSRWFIPNLLGNLLIQATRPDICLFVFPVPSRRCCAVFCLPSPWCRVKAAWCSMLNAASTHYAPTNVNAVCLQFISPHTVSEDN